MSDEIAQAPKEEGLAPQPTIPHSTLDVASSKSDAYETTPSTISTFPESSQQTQTQPDSDPSSSTIAIGSDPSTAAQAHLEAPNIPKRSSSRSKLSPDTITSMPNTSANSNNLGKRGSKNSLRGSRSGSVASNSSKQARIQQREARPKRRGILSILNCCSSSENANEIELAEQEVPPKKTKITQKPGRQSTPGVKSEGKKEDGIGGPEYSEHRPAAKPKMITRSSKDKVSLEKPATKEPEPAPTNLEPPLPPLPSTSSSKDEDRDKLATTSEPPKIVDPEESVAVQGTAINDRTPQQEAQDSDVVMPDAPPVVRDTPEDTAKELEKQQMNLPPPPPRNGQEAVSSNSNEARRWLLPPLQPSLKGKKCLVLDLDETLVHSSFKMLHQADFTIPVEIEGQLHNVYVIKRPGVDHFMKRVGELYEVVVFTASVSKYGDPLLDQLDINRTVHHRLFRESCYHHQGNYVKDLSQVGRDLKEIIIIDNSPTSYIFHPQHAVPISSWFSDAHDNELLDLIPVLEDLAGNSVRDVSMVLDVSL